MRSNLIAHNGRSGLCAPCLSRTMAGVACALAHYPPRISTIRFTLDRVSPSGLVIVMTGTEHDQLKLRAQPGRW